MSTNWKSPDEHPGTPSRVVVGVHGSRSSLRALRHAVGIARDRGWDLEVVTAWPDADDVLIHDVPGRYMVARGRAMESQHDALASLEPVVAPRVETFLANARPAPALVARCTAADLLVVGAGRPEAERNRRSVGAECLQTAPCPVMVVPEPDAQQASTTDRTGDSTSVTGTRRGRGRRSRSRGTKAGTATFA